MIQQNRCNRLYILHFKVSRKDWMLGGTIKYLECEREQYLRYNYQLYFYYYYIFKPLFQKFNTSCFYRELKKVNWISFEDCLWPPKIIRFKTKFYKLGDITIKYIYYLNDNKLVIIFLDIGYLKISFAMK